MKTYMHPHALSAVPRHSDAHSSVQRCAPNQTPPRPQLIQCDNDPCRLPRRDSSYTDFHLYWWAKRPIKTPPYVGVRIRRFEKLGSHSATNEGRPSDSKYVLESPTERALARARYQGPRPLPAVLAAFRGRTPSSNNAARRRRGVFHCRHMAARRRRQTQRIRPISTSGVWQKPKYPCQPRRYGTNSAIVAFRLTLFARRVISRIRHLKRSRALGAIARLTSGSFVKLKPRNFRCCGRATALFVSFTLGLSLCAMKRVMLSITR